MADLNNKQSDEEIIYKAYNDAKQNYTLKNLIADTIELIKYYMPNYNKIPAKWIFDINDNNRRLRFKIKFSDDDLIPEYDKEYENYPINKTRAFRQIYDILNYTRGEDNENIYNTNLIGNSNLETTMLG